jgi:hypothetical protein
VDRYYVLHERIMESMRARRFQDVVAAVAETIPLYNDLVRKTKREYGSFDLETSIAIDKGGKVVAALGRQDILRELERTLRSIPETQMWAEDAARLIEDSETGNRIVGLVCENPGILQASLKERLPGTDGVRIRYIVYWLNKVGRIRQEGEGKSYRLFT